MKPRRHAQGPIRIAIIGVGEMGHFHAERFREIPGCEIVAALDSDRARVQSFCKKFKIPGAFTQVGALLAECQPLDAVAIVSPDRTHGPYAIACLKAGKHVLCEKPLAVSHTQALGMMAAAREAGTVAMVNFSYRNWASIHAVRSLIERGVLGDIRHVEASYLQGWLTNKKSGDWRVSPPYLWRLSSKHAPAGTLGDIGVHILDFATYPVGPIRSFSCRLRSFSKAPRNRIGPYLLDANDSAVLSVEFANGALGAIHVTRWSAGDTNRLYLKISGTKGTVEIDSTKSKDGYRICSGRDAAKAIWREALGKPQPDLYQRFIHGIKTGRNEGPDFARGAEIHAIVDACFASDAAGGSVRLTSRPSKSDRRKKSG